MNGRIAHMDRSAETDDKRPRVFSITSGGRRAILLTSDGVTIEAEHLPGAGPADLAGSVDSVDSAGEGADADRLDGRPGWAARPDWIDSAS